MDLFTIFLLAGGGYFLYKASQKPSGGIPTGGAATISTIDSQGNIVEEPIIGGIDPMEINPYQEIAPATMEHLVGAAEGQYQEGDDTLARQLLENESDNMTETQIMRLNTLLEEPIPLSTYEAAILRDPTTIELDTLIENYNYYAAAPQKIPGSYNRVAQIRDYNRNTYSDYSGRVMVEVIWDTSNGPFPQVIPEDNLRKMLTDTIAEISSKNGDFSHA